MSSAKTIQSRPTAICLNDHHPKRRNIQTPTVQNLLKQLKQKETATKYILENPDLFYKIFYAKYVTINTQTKRNRKD